MSQVTQTTSASLILSIPFCVIVTPRGGKAPECRGVRKFRRRGKEGPQYLRSWAPCFPQDIITHA